MFYWFSRWSITAIQDILAHKYDMAMFYHNMYWCFAPHLCMDFELYSADALMLIPGVNKRFDTFDSKWIHLWTELFDLIKMSCIMPFLPDVLDSVLLWNHCWPFPYIWCACLKSPNNKQIITKEYSDNVAMPAHNRYKTIRMWGETHLLIKASKTKTDWLIKGLNVADLRQLLLLCAWTACHNTDW